MSHRYETRAVLAGAYRGRNSEKNLLTHTHDTEAPPHPTVEFPPLCRRAAHLVDPGGMTEEKLQTPPTCKECLRRDPRFKR